MKREELVEKMASEYIATVQDGERKALIGTLGFRHYVSMGMSAALDVAVGELLKPLLFYRLGRVPVKQINAELDSRRAQLERAKTPRERVEVKRNAQVLPRWDVTLDGELLGQWEAEFTADVYAEGVRSGLISGLKEGAK